MPDPGQTSLLTSVTATSTTNALATGFSGFPSSQQLAERWNGVVWAPTPATSVSVTPFGVAATSATDAWAVGDFFLGPSSSDDGLGTAIVHWNATSWSPVPSPWPG